MAYVPLADQELELHHPHSWVTKYVWSQDHKVIAIQYGGTAIAVGLVALVLSLFMRMQLGFPETFDLIDPNSYYQSVTMHGMIMVIYLLTALFLGGFGNYLIPPHVRRQGHGVPVHEHAQLLGLPRFGDHPAGQFLRQRRAHRGGLDLIPATDLDGGNAGARHGASCSCWCRWRCSSSPSPWAA